MPSFIFPVNVMIYAMVLPCISPSSRTLLYTLYTVIRIHWCIKFMAIMHSCAHYYYLCMQLAAMWCSPHTYMIVPENLDGTLRGHAYWSYAPPRGPQFDTMSSWRAIICCCQRRLGRVPTGPAIWNCGRLACYHMLLTPKIWTGNSTRAASSSKCMQLTGPAIWYCVVQGGMHMLLFIYLFSLIWGWHLLLWSAQSTWHRSVVLQSATPSSTGGNLLRWSVVSCYASFSSEHFRAVIWYIIVIINAEWRGNLGRVLSVLSQACNTSYLKGLCIWWYLDYMWHYIVP